MLRCVHRAFASLAMILLLLAALAGCDSGEEDTPVCRSDDDCKGDRICSGGVCVSPGSDASSDATAHDTPDATSTPDLEADTGIDATPEPDVVMSDPNVLASGQCRAQGLMVQGEHVYWTTHCSGGCLRRVARDGSGTPEDVECQPGGFPLMVVPFRGGLAWAANNGEVKVLDAGSTSSRVVASGQRFEAGSASNTWCNDVIAPSGDRLFWVNDLRLSAAIGRYNALTGAVDSFQGPSNYSDGLVANSTYVYFSANNVLQRVAVDALANTSAEAMGALNGPACASVVKDDTIYMASGGGGIGGASTFYLLDAIGSENLGSFPGLVYYLAANSTHLYFATRDDIYRTRLATLDFANAEHVATVTSRYHDIAGLGVDDDYVYWAQWGDSGEIRRLPLP